MHRMLLLVVAVALLQAACAHRHGPQGLTPQPGAGHLLVIGGAIKDDNQAVYERFIQLARDNANGQTPRILIATAASLDEQPAGEGKSKTIRTYCPDCQIDTISRGTPRDTTIDLIGHAQAMFFTGGDQKRITTRYRPDGVDTPEATAMRRLLARGGTIAGTSAGDAMMSDPMFFGGRSAEALGFHSARTTKTDEDDDDKAAATRPGPQIGTGMGFLLWAITDSHFFERDRFGRLVAALEVSGKKLGLGVGENGCVDVDLATGIAQAWGPGHALVVDARSLRHTGDTRMGIRARVLSSGESQPLARVQAGRFNPRPPGEDAIRSTVDRSKKADASYPLSLLFFFGAQNLPPPHTVRYPIDDYLITGWPDASGWSTILIEPATSAAPGPRS